MIHKQILNYKNDYYSTFEYCYCGEIADYVVYNSNTEIYLCEDHYIEFIETQTFI